MAERRRQIMLGRPITDQDTVATRKVAVINQAFARRFFKGQNPIGQHFGIHKIKYAATYEIARGMRPARHARTSDCIGYWRDRTAQLEFKLSALQLRKGIRRFVAG